MGRREPVRDFPAVPEPGSPHRAVEAVCRGGPHRPMRFLRGGPEGRKRPRRAPEPPCPQGGLDVPSGTVMRKTADPLRKSFAAVGRPMPGRGRKPGRHRLRVPARRRTPPRSGRHPSRRKPPAGLQVRGPNPKPCKWTKSADDILSAVKRFRRRANHKYDADPNSGWLGSPTITHPSPMSHIFRDPAIVGQRRV